MFTINTVISIIVIIIIIIINNMCAYGMYVARKPESRSFSLRQESNQL